MNNIKKSLVYVSLMCCALIFLVGCSKDTGKKDESSKSLTLDFVQTNRHDDSVNKFSMTYDTKPTKALAITNAMIEMMLSLDLQKDMAGTAYAENNIWPPLKKAYDEVPVMGKTYPSKEQILANNVDFIIGWGGDFTDKGVGSIEWLKENNIKAYIPRSTDSNANIDSVYEDFRNLGIIFKTQDKADEVINKIKSELKETTSKIINIDEKVKVLGYDSGTDKAVVVGSGLSNDIIKLAQGENIFGDMDKTYPQVSIEEIVKRNPDVIMVLEYSTDNGGKTFEEKVKELKSNPALKDVNAVKNNRFIKVDLAELYPGERIPRTVKKLAEGFYPDKFNE